MKTAYHDPTMVMDLFTGRKYYYTLAPLQALVACYEQFGRNNFNTWQYKEPDDYDIKSGRYCHLLGNFSTLKFKRPGKRLENQQKR